MQTSDSAGGAAQIGNITAVMAGVRVAEAPSEGQVLSVFHGMASATLQRGGHRSPPRPKIRFRVYLKYELGVVPKTFLNMEMKALGEL
jgi:hypothetical protein